MLSRSFGRGHSAITVYPLPFSPPPSSLLLFPRMKLSKVTSFRVSSSGTKKNELTTIFFFLFGLFCNRRTRLPHGHSIAHSSGNDTHDRAHLTFARIARTPCVCVCMCNAAAKRNLSRTHTIHRAALKVSIFHSRIFLQIRSVRSPEIDSARSKIDDDRLISLHLTKTSSAALFLYLPLLDTSNNPLRLIGRGAR